jgi:hypothetical protein
MPAAEMTGAYIPGAHMPRAHMSGDASGHKPIQHLRLYVKVETQNS